MPESSPQADAPSPAAQVTITKVDYVNGPGYYSFYCNNCAFAVNQLDIVLVLGEMLAVAPDGIATAEQRARVTMPPEQAKAIAKILNFAVTAYERRSKRVVADLGVILPELPPE